MEIDIATQSDAMMEGGDDDALEGDVSNDLLLGLYLLLGGADPLGDPAVDGVESDVVPFRGEAEIQDLSDPMALSLYSDDSVANVICYDVTINNAAYTLYLSPDYIDQLYIDSLGRLWNVGTAAVSGRLFTGDFSATDQTGYILTLGPCLGNNFSSNRSYGSPNYMRYYYWSNSTLTYTTSYVTVKVIQSHYPFKVSDTLGYIIIILLGGALLCLWKRSSR